MTSNFLKMDRKRLSHDVIDVVNTDKVNFDSVYSLMCILHYMRCLTFITSERLFEIYHEGKVV